MATQHALDSAGSNRPETAELKTQLALAEEQVRALRRALASREWPVRGPKRERTWVDLWPEARRRERRHLIAFLAVCVAAAVTLSVFRAIAPQVDDAVKPVHAIFSTALYLTSLILIVAGIYNPRPRESIAAAILSLEAIIIDTMLPYFLGSIPLWVGWLLLPIVAANISAPYFFLRMDRRRSRAEVYVTRLYDPAKKAESSI